MLATVMEGGLGAFHSDSGKNSGYHPCAIGISRVEMRVGCHPCTQDVSRIEMGINNVSLLW